jgi:dTDP-4-dehydrorhamnose 3,5-epimerase
MYLEIKKTKLKDVLIIKPPTIFKDFRGKYIETYNNKIYQKNSINIKFIQDDVSVSKKNVLRGIHGDNKTWKLVSCLYGSFYLVVLNYDRKSKSFGNYISIVLSDKNNLQVLIPPKHGNGHFVLSKQAIFHYKQNTLYEKKSQFTVKWNDPRFKIRWPTKNPILSKRDNLEQ